MTITVRRFALDLPEDETDHPEHGDYLVGPVALYRVIDAVPVESADASNRWRLDVARIGDARDHRCPQRADGHWPCWHYTPHSRSRNRNTP